MSLLRAPDSDWLSQELSLKEPEEKSGFTSTPGIGSTFWAWIPCEISTPGRAYPNYFTAIATPAFFERNRQEGTEDINCRR